MGQLPGLGLPVNQLMEKRDMHPYADIVDILPKSVDA